MHIASKFSCYLLCGALALTASAACADSGVVNGGFESGDFSGWTLQGDPDTNAVAPDMPFSGQYSALFGQVGSSASLSQTVSTEAGRTYSLSFWLSNLGGSINNDSTVSTFSVSAGGASLLSLSDKSATDYTLYVEQFTASAALTSVVFSFRHDESFWALDQVGLAAQPASLPAVPEPSAALLLLAGLGALALHRRARQA